MPQFLSTLAFKLIMGGVLLAVILIGFKTCTGARQEAAQAKNDAKGSEATAATALKAAETVIDRADSNATLDQLVADTQKEIANATDSKVSRTAATNAVCSMFDGDSKPAGC